MKPLLLILLLTALLSGCSIISLVAIPLDLAGDVAGGTIKATGSVAGATIKTTGDIVTPDGKPKEKDAQEDSAD